MKKAFALIVIFILGFFSLFLYTKEKLPFSKTFSPTASLTGKKLSPSQEKKYLFVPYWTFTDSINAKDFDSILYFALSANENGIDKEDPGFDKLGNFISVTDSNKERILTIRMTDASVNSEVLQSDASQEKIISESISFAKEYGYDGILLDFETSAFGFENTTKNISNFYYRFGKATHSNNLLFYVTLFGDTYYRARAYDIKHIGKLSDKVLVMTYDFHKSRGNPGPNFPLKGKEEYGYDLDKMVEEYQKDVDNGKIVVVLGYFGYDWQVDKSNEALASGEPLSTNKIRQDFVNSCVYKNCSLKRNLYDEPSITYIDNQENRHIVWFEDEKSIKNKLSELSNKGINQTGVWAYSYY